MAYIQISYAGVSSANQILSKAVQEIAQIEETLAALKNAVDPQIQSRFQIGDRLQECQRSAETIGTQSKRLLKTAEAGVLAYKIAQSRLKRVIPGDLEALEAR